MHVPTFLRQCNDLHSLPPERVTQEIALPFLALYFTVCTVSWCLAHMSCANRPPARITVHGRLGDQQALHT